MGPVYTESGWTIDQQEEERLNFEALKEILIQARSETGEATWPSDLVDRLTKKLIELSKRGRRASKE